jgi:hypothetical protein
MITLRNLDMVHPICSGNAMGIGQSATESRKCQRWYFVAAHEGLRASGPLAVVHSGFWAG